MQTMGWRDVDGTFVLVHKDAEPSDDEWSAYVEAIGRRFASDGGFRALVFTPGPGPNMRQRQRLAQAAPGIRAPTAVVTTSTVARAIVTLIRLRFPAICAFDPGSVEAALEHVGASGEAKNRLRWTLNELRRDLGFTGEL